ncbi:C-C chemokine receptor type 3-like isoform X2 [Lynx canadensis]|nr:C-C chemokine receptor type 3-like isoform X2 [Lynx canadensis]XP_030161784.1 C-C chemokine receptor type 3-like isoform X2 [Lynx canadensis]XP_030161789.1 C-C chemokine receptor type 3-like isoform X2 [Lynx canadensis]XP_030161790.1 C-C chemokine receptor type 3-like isoform X2 [Lynx canadensis]XP_030161795.1 C-C chemokine receptor type 3-like isoform X2 [Lynx canadensis]XP_030161809.1 C-C chemokine receptor type 3-like isoform X2 [Lynx canadensis]XP_030161830.1 C-C chemokine receptor typ
MDTSGSFNSSLPGTMEALMAGTEPVTADASVRTTLFDYEFSLPCEKINVKELGSRLLPPLYSLVFVVGLLGNAMVVVILTKYRRLRIMTNIFLLNLAISDLLFLFTLLFWIHYSRWNNWVFGHFMCKLLSGLYYMGLYSEIFFIILLTIDRYLAIVHAVFALRTRTVAFGIIMSVLTWGLAGIAALPEFIFHQSQNDAEQYICLPLYPGGQEDNWKRFHALSMNILSLALPLLIMAVCYAGIIRTLLRCPNKTKYKAIRLIFVIMVVFFMFWTPYNLVLLLSAFQTIFFEVSCEQSKWLDVAMQVTEVIAYTHCCVNPVIYAFVGERFREHLSHFFRRHVATNLGKYIPFLPSEKSDRASSGSPSTGEQELSFVF